MRKFSSYGQLNTNVHYYAPREELLHKACTQLIGEDPEEGGHYITIWAPRQTGKSTIMLETLKRLRKIDDFDVVILTLQSAKSVHTEEKAVRLFVNELQYQFDVELPQIRSWEDLPKLFTSDYLSKPLILILDEFDALDEVFINSFANEFRKMYTARFNEVDKKSSEKTYLLHSLALIGVRSVLGIENVSGSPFNVQRSLHIPNLTLDEVDGMFKYYERESGQKVEQEVIERLYYETAGHPGLICWFGELLSEGFEDYRPPQDEPIARDVFEKVYRAATHILPNNTVLNIISKAKQEAYKGFVLDLFKTDEKISFSYDQPQVNYLYMNGVIAQERSEEQEAYIKFSSPFAQKRLFNYFSNELFHYIGKVYTPFEDLTETISDDRIYIPNVMRRYERHLRANREWLLKDAPRRADLRIYEAVFHFNLYMYLHRFLAGFDGRVYPEFPTGNGKIDLIIEYAGKTYGLEVKSYTTHKEFQKALGQAAEYGRQLQLAEIYLIVFVESIDEANRTKYEAAHLDRNTGLNVVPVFVEIG